MEPVGRSVLLVDDDEDARDALAETLLERGFTVNTAQNGRAALEWLHRSKQRPAVVLLDLAMPVMDGRAFLHVRHSDPGLSRIPVFVVSAEKGCSDLAQSHDVKGVLPKPITLDGLLAAIEGLHIGA